MSYQSNDLWIGGVWLAVLLLLFRWQMPHEYSHGRFGDTTYFPHISHGLTWLYIGLTTAIVAVMGAKSSEHSGPLLLLLVAAWHFWCATRLFVGWARNKDVRF